MEPDADLPISNEKKTESGNELELFISEAIEDGLLVPSEPNAFPTDDLADEDTAAVVATPDQSSAPAPSLEICGTESALDFSTHREFRRYDEVHRVRELANQSEQGALAPTKSTSIAKVHLALGLYSEARMELRQNSSPDAAIYRKLAELLENRHAPDVAYFESLAACHSSAGLWLSVAKLIAGHEGGATEFDPYLNDFRKLPAQLKADITTLVVPRLITPGRSILAEKIVADFTEEDIRNSTQLQFAKALTGLAAGDPDAEPLVRSYLNNARFQKTALASLMLQQRPVNAMHPDVLVGDLINRLDYAQSSEDLQSSLQFVLQELGSRSGYEKIIGLIEIPALQDSYAQAQIRQTLTTSLERDFDSQDPLRNLAAIHMLESYPYVLETDPMRLSLYETALRHATRFGLNSIAQRLYIGSSPTDQGAQNFAALALQRQDYAMVYAMVERRPDDHQLNLIAAIGAIRDQNPSLLGTFSRRLSPDPETLLTLVEEDALSGHWIVPARIYDAAQLLDSPVARQRFERVMSIKTATNSANTKVDKMTISKVGSALQRSSAASKRENGGA